MKSVELNKEEIEQEKNWDRKKWRDDACLNCGTNWFKTWWFNK